MNKKTLTALMIAVAVIHATALPGGARAQGGEAKPASGGGGGSVAINNQAGRVQIKLERGSRVSISNRFGRITVTGWDRDTVEATATSDKGAEAVQVEMTADPSARSVLALNVPGRPGQRGTFTPFVYANPSINVEPHIYMTTPPAPAVQGGTPAAKPTPKPAPKPAAQGGDENNVVILPVPDQAANPPGVAAVSPRRPAASTSSARGASASRTAAAAVASAIGVGGGNSANSINLDVKVPRYAQLETLEVRSGDLTVSDIDGPVSVSSGSSNITVSRVGSLELRARSGDINVEGVEGLVYIVASSGTIKVKGARGDVRATSINGDINIQCVRGRVDASNARGGIVLGSIDGDVEASTTDAEINFTGAIRPQGRYRLKSMEGRIVMAIPESSPGFTAILASYNNEVVTTFPVTSEDLVGGGMRVNRRIVVKQGSGDAQIMLDSFGQTVNLTKLAPANVVSCK